MDTRLRKQQCIDVNDGDYQTEVQVATEHGKGRSINLTLSCRGKEALKHIKLDEEIINNCTIPVYGRLVHDVSGKRRKVPYGKSDEFISSIDRWTLNKVLLEEVKKHNNVTCYFNHKLVVCDIEKGEITFEQTKNGDKINKKTNLIIGTDGAHSVVRQQIMKETHMNYQQEYIKHGYMELIIPATESGELYACGRLLEVFQRELRRRCAFDWRVCIIFENAITKIINLTQANLIFPATYVKHEQLGIL
ncbi:KMO [Mytilus coruscus]|uniref:KMO n=1 Tax=Mytilus coruscus TaxID=42192 RepID=A0A6J8AMK1_MYTCO|nr:KMO [Mytilus coruscus]